jgi:enamine deaminase RidA (YjgF/YER057c/UK114 family)
METALMTRQLISTGSPMERAYGYSRAVVDDDFIFVAGTTGYDYTRMILPIDAGDQTRNIWRTVARVLAEAGASLADIVRVQYFITDRADAEVVLSISGAVLADIRPAAGIYVVAGLLDAAMKVEIEVTARRREGWRPLPIEPNPIGTVTAA